MSTYSANSQTVGVLSDESHVFKEVSWMISNGYFQNHIPNYDVRSPSFSFANATWVLHVSPFGHSELNSVGWIDLGLERLDSKILDHHVFCKFYFLTRRGKKFEPYQEYFTFNPQCKINYMMYAETFQFLLKENIVSNNGVFTIVCQIRTPKIVGIEAFSQTELTEPVAKSPVEDLKQEIVSSATISKKPPVEDHKQEIVSSASVSKDSDCASLNAAPLSVNKLLQDFKELFLNQKNCDVIIKVSGQQFQAHRNIIEARSPVFASTFRNEMKEKATGVIDIDDCDPSSFSDFLCFLYCGKIENLSTENVFSLFKTADKYDVQDLRSECLEFIKNNLSVDTFCETISLALQHLENELIEMATDFFAKNLQDIIVTVKWQAFLVENPIQSNEIMVKALVANKK